MESVTSGGRLNQVPVFPGLGPVYFPKPADHFVVSFSFLSWRPLFPSGHMGLAQSGIHPTHQKTRGFATSHQTRTRWEKIPQNRFVAGRTLQFQQKKTPGKQNHILDSDEHVGRIPSDHWMIPLQELHHKYPIESAWQTKFGNNLFCYANTKTAILLNS